jgi:hypothetical protein
MSEYTGTNKPARTARRRIALIGAAVGALVAAPLAAWGATVTFNDVPPSHPAFQDITAVASAGIMTGNANGNFRPGGVVTRSGLAQILHRGLSRLAVDDSVSDISANPADPETIAATNVGIGGFEPGNQGVLVELSMQVETAAPLAANCTLTLSAISTPENLDVGEWTTHLYAGDRGATVNAVFTDSQLAGTLYTYEVSADHDCGQALHVVDGALVAQTAAFTGNGQAFPD